MEFQTFKNIITRLILSDPESAFAVEFHNENGNYTAKANCKSGPVVFKGNSAVFAITTRWASGHQAMVPEHILKLAAL